MRALMLSAASCALVVAGFLVYNAMSMAITQRRPVISLLRAIGATRGRSSATCWWRPGWWGWSGGILGSALGVLIGRAGDPRASRGALQGYESRTEYILPSYAIPVGVAACIVVSVAAAALAARQVYKVAPVEALAPVGASTADAVARPVRVAAGVIGIGLIAAAIYVATADLGKISVAAIALTTLGEIALCFAVRRFDGRGDGSGCAAPRRARCSRRSDCRTCAAPCLGDVDDSAHSRVGDSAKHRIQYERDRLDRREFRIVG